MAKCVRFIDIFIYTVEPRYNELLYYESICITNDFLYRSNGKI